MRVRRDSFDPSQGPKVRTMDIVPGLSVTGRGDDLHFIVNGKVHSVDPITAMALRNLLTDWQHDRNRRIDRAAQRGLTGRLRARL